MSGNTNYPQSRDGEIHDAIGKVWKTDLGHMRGWGATVPTDGDDGWAPGALFQNTGLTGATDALYCNISTDPTSCDFNAVTVAT